MNEDTCSICGSIDDAIYSLCYRRVLCEDCHVAIAYGDLKLTPSPLVG